MLLRKSSPVLFHHRVASVFLLKSSTSASRTEPTNEWHQAQTLTQIVIVRTRRSAGRTILTWLVTSQIVLVVKIVTWLQVRAKLQGARCTNSLYINSWATVPRANSKSKDWKVQRWISVFKEASRGRIRTMMAATVSMKKWTTSTIITEAIQVTWVPRVCHQ